MATVESKSKDSKKDKKKNKGKGKPKSSAYVDDVDGDLTDAQAYRPPEGAVLLTDYMGSEDFDYDTLKENEDLELWVIRVPDVIKAKHLSNISVTLPSSPGSSNIGSLPRKGVSYDIWSLDKELADQNTIAGGDEVLGLSCLVPRKRKGEKLFRAPVPISRHLVLSAQPALPTPPPSSPDTPGVVSRKGPERYRHPAALLKHRFQPHGTVSDLQKNAESSTMDADMEASQTSVGKVEKSRKKLSHPEQTAVESSPVKKRKGEDDTPKKSKKSKTSS